ncbi:hypothetical protein [Brevibacterium otitidis]|uniref:Short chain dehydrogenase n=1 Tax=Brevibacterium otitidis TaxID=53364 RepID=A0ABV5X339_9MICO|nr:hypothetical protein GCM10023233_32910 [Brevibacterium otitidis]
MRIQTWNRYRPNRAYGNAKLANILFTKGLHSRFHDQGLSSVAFHPGNVATSFASDTSSYFHWVYHGALNRFLMSPEQGGVNLAYFITGKPGSTWRSGEYYNDPRKLGRTNKQVGDSDLVARHWYLSAQLLDIAWSPQGQPPKTGTMSRDISAGTENLGTSSERCPVTSLPRQEDRGPAQDLVVFFESSILRLAAFDLGPSQPTSHRLPQNTSWPASKRSLPQAEWDTPAGALSPAARTSLAAEHQSF